jgi:hypothetical protein
MQTPTLPGHSASGNVGTSSSFGGARYAPGSTSPRGALESGGVPDVRHPPRVARGGHARVKVRRGDVEGGSQ